MDKKIKVALVTGGSGDIGQAICFRLGIDGYHVIVHANTNLKKAQEVVNKINERGGSAEAISFDITNYKQTSDALNRLLQKQTIQVIVHNAGIHDDVPLAGMTKERWDKVIDVSLNGFFNITQPLLLPMMKTRWGRVIAMGSIAGLMGNRGQANYAAAKAGLQGACKSLSQEVASRGITVNVIAPGIIKSEMTESVFSDDIIKKIVPMKRAGNVDEVASLVSFLSSTESNYISGQVISINGGMV